MLNYRKKNLIKYAIFFTILWMSVSWVSIILANNINNPNYKGIQCPKTSNFKSLPDIIHDNISDKNKIFSQIANNGLNILVIIWITCIIYNLYFNNIYTLKYIIIITIFLSVVSIIRIFSFSATIMPPISKGCIPPKNNIVFNVLKLLKNEELTDTECVDFMFSGHEIYILTIIYSLIFTNIGKTTFFSRDIVKLLLILVSLCVIFSISASKLHYTSDIIISFIITTSLFYITFNKFLKKI